MLVIVPDFYCVKVSHENREQTDVFTTSQCNVQLLKYQVRPSAHTVACLNYTLQSMMPLPGS